MRWTWAARLTGDAGSGRRSRVVLTPRRRRQVSQKCLRGDGDKKARSPGRARNKLLKPLRAGMPGDPGATVVTNARAYYSTRAAAGATGTRHSPRPLLGEESLHNSGVSRRGNAEVYLMNTDSQHFRPSPPTKAGDPVFRGVSDRTEKLRRTGYSAFAEYDGLARIRATRWLAMTETGLFRS